MNTEHLIEMPPAQVDDLAHVAHVADCYEAVAGGGYALKAKAIEAIEAANSALAKVKAEGQVLVADKDEKIARLEAELADLVKRNAVTRALVDDRRALDVVTTYLTKKVKVEQRAGEFVVLGESGSSVEAMVRTFLASEAGLPLAPEPKAEGPLMSRL